MIFSKNSLCLIQQNTKISSKGDNAKSLNKNLKSNISNKHLIFDYIIKLFNKNILRRRFTSKKSNSSYKIRIKKFFLILHLILFFGLNFNENYLNLYIITHKDFPNKINRIFHFQNHVPNLNKIFTKYDVIINRESNLKKSIKDQFSYFHCGNLLDEVVEIIKNNFPEYYSTAINTLNRTSLSCCNIFIMKKDDFIKYGEFVFGILMEFDRRHNLTNDEDIQNFIKTEFKKLGKNKYNIFYQSRHEGFILERISNIFYAHHFKNKYQIAAIKK